MNPLRSAPLVLAVAITLCLASPSTAYIALKEPLAHKVAAADCVVLGKITAIQDEPVKGQGELGRWDFTVVEVEVKESLYAEKDKKKLRFGLLTVGYKPGPAVGETGFFCGLKVDKNDFYVVPAGCFFAEKGAGFEKDLPVARRLGRLLEDPDKGLKSTDADDRLLTAQVMLLRYCYVPWRRGLGSRPQPIDAEQSKRILMALAEGDWKKNREAVRDAVDALRFAVKFGAPPLKDYPPEEGQEQWAAAAKQWLRQNAESYRVHRLK